MIDIEQRRFRISDHLDVVIDDDGLHDPTGILCIRWFDKDRTQLGSLPILPGDVADLVKALVLGAMALEQKGVRLTMYNAGYLDGREGRPPEVEPRWPKQ